MALLGASKSSERYIFVETESVDNQVETTSHPTETGIPLSDTVHRNPIVLNLSGKIVDTDTVTAKSTIAKIKSWQSAGETLTYTGQSGVFKSMQIQSFVHDYNNKNFGGADFDMTLQEVRIAKKAYVKPKTTNSTVISKPKTIKVGDTVCFTGGAVYVSSDAKRAASVRGRSDCKVTKIATYSWSKHKYHLKSVDGRLVYGWVDEANVKAAGMYARAYTNGGTQQTQSSGTKTIYHKVKKGDTIWSLVNTVYRSKNLSMDEIIAANPKSFAAKGRASTLIVGSKLMITYE